jgi:tetratricopeptide (TPR) repeat protein
VSELFSHVDEMIVSSSIEQIRSDLDNMTSADRAAISDELNKRLQGARDRNRPAEAALIQHLLGFVEAASSPDPAPDTNERAEALREEAEALRQAQAAAQSRASAGDVSGAIEVLEEAVSGEAIGIATARLRLQLGGYLRQVGRSDRAIETVTPPIDEYETYPELASQLAELVLPCLALRALLYEDLGDLDAAEADRVAAVRVADFVLEPGALLQAESDLAAYLLKRGRPRDAARRFAGVVTRALRQGDPEVIAAARTNYAISLLECHRPADAAREYQGALDIRLGRPESPLSAIANDWFGLSRARQALGDASGARTARQQGLQAGLRSPNRVAAQAVYLHQVEDLLSVDVADIELAERSLEEARKAGPMLVEASIASILARLYERSGDPSRAMRVLQTLLERIEAGELDDLVPPVVGAKVELARLLMEHASAPQEAFDLVWPVGEAGTFPIQLILRLLLLHGSVIRLPDARNAAELAFDLHEAAKARPFLAKLAIARLPTPDITPALIKREQELLDIQRELERQLGVITDARSRQALTTVRNELDSLWSTFENRHPEYVRMRRGRPATLSELRQALTNPNASVAMLSYFVSSRFTFWFLVRGANEEIVFECEEIPEQELVDAARRLRQSFNGDMASFPPVAPIPRKRPWRRDLAFLDVLGPRLLPPDEFLEEIDLLCVAPHGPLLSLPIHALRSPEGKVLSSQTAVTYTPSASALVHLRTRTRPRSVGRIRALVAGVASLDDAHPEYFEDDARLFTHTNVDLENLSGKAADPASVADRLTRCQLAHITCHGHYDRREPLDSGLVLSDGLERPPRAVAEGSLISRQRFLLSARELLRREIEPKLVTLRACSSAAQFEEYEGEGMLDLPRSLLYAGADAVIATLWNVDQQSSLELLEHFYRLWDWGRMPAGRALAEAQREMQRSVSAPEYAHPYHWAPFILVGDWR